MVLRAVARARASRLARSLGRKPSSGSAAGDPERIRRRPAHRRAVEQAERSQRTARPETALRAALLRQFRLGPQTNASRSSRILAQLSNLPREIRSTQVLVR